MIAWIRRLVRGRKPSEPSASELALERTQRDRRQTEARGKVITSVMAPWRRAREENHWAERIEAAYSSRRRATP